MKRGLLALFFFLTASVAFAAQQTPAAVNGCIYNSSPPSLTTGQSSVFQCDSSGNLIVSATFSGTIGTVGQGAAAISGPWIETPWIAGAVNSATNGLYFNLLQGNAVNASGNPIFVQLTAGSAIVGNLGIDQTTPGTTNGVALVGVNAATMLAGSGAVGTGSARVAVGQDATTTAGSPPGRTYNTIAASQTAQALTGGSGGATGDYLAFCTVFPTTVSPGVVTILDNATTIDAFPGGASSLSNLAPFTIPVGAVSVSGAWKVTTGAGLSVTCAGKFT